MAKLTNKKEIFGWCMFDFANSAYTQIIISTVFCVFFVSAVAPNELKGVSLWSWMMAISNLFIVITGPIFGAIADHSGSKKIFLFLTYIICVVFTGLLFIVNEGDITLAFVFVVLSNIGFAASENFVSSFLPEIASREDMGRVSGYGWALGYWGGLLALVCCLPLIMFEPLADFGENFDVRTTNLITALFFALAALPTFLWVKERKIKQPMPKGHNYLTIGFARIADTFREIKLFKELMKFLPIFLIFYAGVSIIIMFASIYASEALGFSMTTIIILLIVVNVNSSIGAFIFGYIQDRIGAKVAINISLVIWIIAIITAFIITPSKQRSQSTQDIIFYQDEDGIITGNDDGTLSMWDYKGGTEAKSLDLEGGAIYALEHIILEHAEKEYIAVGMEDGTVHFINQEKGSRWLEADYTISSMDNFKSPVYSIKTALNGNEKLLAVADEGGGIRIYNINNGISSNLEPVYSFVHENADESAVMSMVFMDRRRPNAQQNSNTYGTNESQDSAINQLNLFCITRDGKIELFRPVNNNMDDYEMQVWATNRTTIYDVLLYENSKLLICDKNGYLKIWNINENEADKKLFGEMKIHSGEARDMKIIKESGRLLTCGFDKCVRVWDIQRVINYFNENPDTAPNIFDDESLKEQLGVYELTGPELPLYGIDQTKVDVSKSDGKIAIVAKTSTTNYWIWTETGEDRFENMSFTAFIHEKLFLLAQKIFWIVAVFAGIALGSVQSASRALIGLFSPESKSAEFFGFWGFAGKLGAVGGPLLFGFITALTGGQRYAVLSCAILFIIGFILMFFINEKSGIESAKKFDEKQELNRIS